jgi:glycerophosphoryl diester phosphodiesterase
MLAGVTERTFTTRLAALALAAVLALTAVACSDDDAGDRADDQAAAPSTTEPAATTVPEVEEPAVSVIAHRGASADAPELTVAAFDLAIEQGAHVLELDVHLTADGEVVVIHDDTLDRTARGPADRCTGPVGDQTLEQLGACEFGSWFNEEHPDRADPAFEGLAIPTLTELVDRYGTDVGWLIETKSPEAQPGLEEAVLAVLDDTGLLAEAAPGEVVVQSFSAESLRSMHEARPDVPLVQLLSIEGPIDEARLDDVATYAVGIGPLYALVDEAMVDAALERCLRVTPWTVDEPAEMDRLLDLGVHGLITNVPTVALEATADRPAPPELCEPAASRA